MKQKVLITGALKLPPSDKKEMIPIVRQVEAGITQAKLSWHPHLLADRVVISGAGPEVVTQIQMASEFARVMRLISTRKYNLVRGARHEMADADFNLALTVRRILDEQVKHTFAGIAILTWESPGALHLIGQLEQIGLPVLCLSNRDNFGTVLNGSFSLNTVTRVYSNVDVIKPIVAEFLKTQKINPAMVVKSYSLPATFVNLLSHMPNASEFVADAVREKLETQS